MTRKILLAAAAALTLATVSIASVGTAEAGPWHPHHHHHGGYWGAGAAGLATGLVVGGLIASSQPTYAAPVYDDEEPVRRCWRVERLNRWGEVIGWRRVCRGY